MEPTDFPNLRSYVETGKIENEDQTEEFVFNCIAEIITLDATQYKTCQDFLAQKYESRKDLQENINKITLKILQRAQRVGIKNSRINQLLSPYMPDPQVLIQMKEAAKKKEEAAEEEEEEADKEYIRKQFSDKGVTLTESDFNNLLKFGNDRINFYLHKGITSPQFILAVETDPNFSNPDFKFEVNLKEIEKHPDQLVVHQIIEQLLKLGISPAFFDGPEKVPLLNNFQEALLLWHTKASKEEVAAWSEKPNRRDISHSSYDIQELHSLYGDQELFNIGMNSTIQIAKEGIQNKKWDFNSLIHFCAFRREKIAEWQQEAQIQQWNEDMRIQKGEEWIKQKREQWIKQNPGKDFDKEFKPAEDWRNQKRDEWIKQNPNKDFKTDFKALIEYKDNPYKDLEDSFKFGSPRFHSMDTPLGGAYKTLCDALEEIHTEQKNFNPSLEKPAQEQTYYYAKPDSPHYDGAFFMRIEGEEICLNQSYIIPKERKFPPSAMESLMGGRAKILLDAIKRIVHAPYISIEPLLKEAANIYEKAMQTDNLSEMLPLLGKMFWIICQAKPWIRGDPSIAEMMFKSMLLSKGFEPPRWKSGIIPWVEASKYIDGDAFGRDFASFLQLTKESS